MRIFKRIASFVLLNLLIFGLLNTVQMEPPQLDYMIKEFWEGDYTGVVLGHSNSTVGIEAELLEDENGRIYNYGRRMTEFPDCYYLLRELDRDGKVETVYLEIDDTYWVNDYFNTIPRGWDVNMYYHLSGIRRLQYIWEVSLHKPVLSMGDYPVEPHLFLQCLKTYPGNMKARIERALDAEDEKTIHKSVKMPVEVPVAEQPQEDKHFDYTPMPFSPEQVCAINCRYFDRIADYCEKNEIRLICFSTALPPVRLLSENHGDRNRYFKELLASRDLPYYDMSFAKKEYLDYGNKDFMDANGHAERNLAILQTALLKRAVQEENMERYFYTDYEEVIGKFQ